MKNILSIEIGDVFGDMKCVDILKYNHNRIFYVMECTKCYRKKNMLSSTIRLQKGIYHKSCGRNLKTKDEIFYSRWCAMRTRTTNQKYEH